MDITENIKQVRRIIDRHARSSGRDPRSITLVGVTKNVDTQKIRLAVKGELYDFGENYAQEFRDKSVELSDLEDKINWHFIGTLQKNKVKYLVGKVRLIHSVHKLSVAEEIDKRFGRENLTAPVLIEVNIAREESKEGADIDNAEKLLSQTVRLKNLEVKGFMTMAPYFEDPEESRYIFRELAELKRVLSGKYNGLDHLSMGMSNDYHIAVEEGATIVRIGSSIFGRREY